MARATGLSVAALAPELHGAGGVLGLAEAQTPFEAGTLGPDAAAISAKAARDAAGAGRARRWAEESREAIEAHTRWVEENGLPLEDFRMV